jgi:hypothetical protein
LLAGLFSDFARALWFGLMIFPHINPASPDLKLASEGLFPGHFPLEIFPAKLLFRNGQE